MTRTSSGRDSILPDQFSAQQKTIDIPVQCEPIKRHVNIYTQRLDTYELASPLIWGNHPYFHLQMVYEHLELHFI
jgi:hypothetical protein